MSHYAFCIIYYPNLSGLRPVAMHQ